MTLQREKYDVVIVGAGPAGLAAAIKAYDTGAKHVLIIERDEVLGGILNQCIHNGFGLHRFREELTGPEYADRFIQELSKRPIETLLKTTVLSIEPDHRLLLMNEQKGVFSIEAKAVVLAMGCRERPRGALNIPGSRPSGIFSAGTAQRLMNIEGMKVGNRVVILGSGDIGLIMARRLTLEGAEVLCVAEVMPFSGGLKRNIVQCLYDYDIPLYLSSTIVSIEGETRVTGCVIAEVDEARRVIPGTERHYDCDTILLSVGLIPENELTEDASIPVDPRTRGAYVDDHWMTKQPGIFACGNVLHVHDLVDFVSEEAERAGKSAALYALDTLNQSEDEVGVEAGEGVGYVLPQSLHIDLAEDSVPVRFRVRKVYRGVSVCVAVDGEIVQKKKKRILAPGEMETVMVQRSLLAEKRPKKLCIYLEESHEE